MVEIKNESVYLIITSPPYFDLKNYDQKKKNKNQSGEDHDLVSVTSHRS